jgi:hypothetical protein
VCAAAAAVVVVVAHGLVSFDDRERSISSGSFWLSQNPPDEGKSNTGELHKRVSFSSSYGTNKT